MKHLAKALGGSCLESVLTPALALVLTGVTVSCRDRCLRLKEDLEGHAGTC